MTAGVYVNATRTRIVPEGSPEAAYRIHVTVAEKLGLLPRAGSPEAKEKPKPADKAVRKPATK
jgi:hypothetical protein